MEGDDGGAVFGQDEPFTDGFAYLVKGFILTTTESQPARAPIRDRQRWRCVRTYK